MTREGGGLIDAPKRTDVPTQRWSVNGATWTRHGRGAAVGRPRTTKRQFTKCFSRLMRHCLLACCMMPTLR